MNDTSLPNRVVIIGAGFAGLATAALLARAGVDVTVVEQNDGVGGRSGEIEADGFRWDTGPSWYLMPDAFDHFFQLLGTTTAQQLELVDLDPGYRIFPEGQPAVDVPTGRDNAIAFFESVEPGAGQKLADYLDSARDAYDIAVDRFLYTTFSSLGPLVHKDVRQRIRPLTSLLTTPLDTFVGTKFQSTLLRQILEYPAVFLSSRPEKTPAMYHLMSHTDLVQGVSYPQGGFMAVAQAIYRLANENGARFVFNTSVTAITTEGTHATGVRVRTPDGVVDTIAADVVISCADLHHTETHLLPEKLRSYPESSFAHKDPGIGTVLVLLGVSGKLPQLRHHNLFFSEDWRDDFDVVFSGPTPNRLLDSSHSIYVSMPSATDPAVAPKDHENLFVLIPTPAQENFGHGDAYRDSASARVTNIANQAIDQISRWADIPDLAERIVVRKTLGPSDFSERYNAWRGGSIGPAHTLRQSAFLRGSNKSKKVAGLYYAGATTVPGVGVPMCLISAENIVKRLRSDSSPGPLSPDWVS